MRGRCSRIDAVIDPRAEAHLLPPNNLPPVELVPSGMKLIPRVLQWANNAGFPALLFWSMPVFFSALLLVLNLRLVTFPYQMEYREGAIQLTTAALLRGINPWAAENQPLYCNVYGFVYNWIILPFAAVLGNSLWIHRLVSFAAILAQLAIIAAVLRKRNVPAPYILLALPVIWVTQLFYVIPLARPDTTGQFFFLLCIYSPFIGKYSLRSLITSIASGLIAFYTKPYFALGLAIVPAYLLLFVSKKRALQYAGVALLSSLCTLPIVLQLAPGYFVDTYYSHLVFQRPSSAHMVKQFARFGSEFWAFIAICIFGAVRNAFSNSPTTKGSWRLWAKLDAPILDMHLDVSALAGMFSAAVLYASLGRHAGNDMVYYYQLLTPFVVVLAITSISAISQPLRKLLLVLLAVNLLTLGATILPADLGSYDSEGWHQLDVYLALSRNAAVVNSPVMVSQMIAGGAPIINSGSNQYLVVPRKPSILYPNLEQLTAAVRQFHKEQSVGINTARFKFLFLAEQSVNKRTDLGAYEIVDRITVLMPHAQQEWHLVVMAPRAILPP